MGSQTLRFRLMILHRTLNQTKYLVDPYALGVEVKWTSGAVLGVHRKLESVLLIQIRVRMRILDEENNFIAFPKQP